MHSPMVANNRLRTLQAVGIPVVAGIGAVTNACWFHAAKIQWEVWASSAGVVMCSLMMLLGFAVAIFPASTEMADNSDYHLKVIRWYNVADYLPEYHGRKVRYLVAWGHRPFVQEGIWNGKQWGDQTGCEIRAVWAWAPMPNAPPYPDSDPVAELFKSKETVEADGCDAPPLTIIG